MGSNLNREDYGRKLAEYGRKMMMQGMRLVKENGMGSKLYQNGGTHTVATSLIRLST